MKNIEEIIRNNREYFDQEEPSSGHDLRFSKKLENRERIVFLVRISTIAAGFVILAGLWFLYQPTSRMINSEAQLTLGVLRPEYKEVEHSIQQV